MPMFEYYSYELDETTGVRYWIWRLPFILLHGVRAASAGKEVPDEQGSQRNNGQRGTE